MVEKIAIGIDFGTTNSLFSVILSGKPKYFLDENNTTPYPSVVSYDKGEPVIGTEAKSRLDTLRGDVVNGVVRSPKKQLGKGPVYVLGREMQPKNIVADLLKGLKQKVIDEVESEGDEVSLRTANFDKAVVSIPVAMEGKTRRELRDACLQAGIQIVQFVHEPLAALYAHFRGSGQVENMIRDYQDKLVLVYDWGGGTLDLTLCHILSGQIIQIANVGDNEVGGDYIDEAMREYILEKVATERNFPEMPPIRPGAKSRLLNQCEKTKKTLSERMSDDIYIEDFFIFDNGKDDPDLECQITRDELNRLSIKIINRGLSCINEILKKYDISQRRISLCLATGGMVHMPEIRKRLQEYFSLDRLVISDRGDKIISEGCAWIASDGARLGLAKVLEVREARNSYVKIFQEGTRLPLEGETISSGDISLYCVDPRDGRANIQVCKPEKPDKKSNNDPRMNCGILTVPVDSKLNPFMERLLLRAAIDHDLILHVQSESVKSRESDSIEIFDLEFGLKISTNNTGSNNLLIDENLLEKAKKLLPSGSIVVRSNVTGRYNDQTAIPGEYLHAINPFAFDTRVNEATSQQIKEYHIYSLCAICGRIYNDPICQCSTPLRKRKAVADIHRAFTKI